MNSTLSKLVEMVRSADGAKRSDKVASNTVANTVSTIVNALSQLVLVPFYITHWSKAVTGEWSVLWAVPSLIWCLDGGFARLAGSKGTMAVGAGEIPRARAIVSTIFYLQLITLALIDAIGLGLLYGTNLATLFGSHSISLDQVRFILTFALIYLTVSFNVSLLKSVYMATDNAARGIWLGTIDKLVEMILVVAALSLGARPVDLAWLFVIPFLAVLIFGCIDLSRRQCLIPLTFSPKLVSLAEMRSALHDGLPAMASQLASTLNLEGSTIVVFLALGPAAVVTVTSVRTVCRLIFQAVQVINAAVFPEISRAFGAGNFSMVREFLEQSSRKIIWLSLACTAGLVVLGGPVVSCWTRGAVIVSPMFLCLFSSTILIQSGWSVCASALVATNKHHLFSVHLFLTNVLAMGLSFMFCRRFGENGVPLASLVGDGVLAMCAWAEFRKILPKTVPFRLGESLKFPVWSHST